MQFVISLVRGVFRFAFAFVLFFFRLPGYLWRVWANYWAFQAVKLLPKIESGAMVRCSILTVIPSRANGREAIPVLYMEGRNFSRFDEIETIQTFGTVEIGASVGTVLFEVRPPAHLYAKQEGKVLLIADAPGRIDTQKHKHNPEALPVVVLDPHVAKPAYYKPSFPPKHPPIRQDAVVPSSQTERIGYTERIDDKAYYAPVFESPQMISSKGIGSTERIDDNTPKEKGEK